MAERAQGLGESTQREKRSQMAASTVPQAVQSCHELLLWLIPQLDKFPRSRRFSGTGDSAKGLALILDG
jgi:hypothetical protein